MARPAQELARTVTAQARRLGFARVGVCEASPSDYGAELRAWLDAGRHGSMAYLEEHFDLRTDPAGLLDGARSVVMVADQYAQRGGAEDPPLEPGRGRIARYARGRDYHKTIKKRLHTLCDRLSAAHPGASFRAFVDTAPVMERELASRAGIGWVAKHTLVINPRVGSYLLLGGVLTTLELEAPPEQKPARDHCGTCTRCIDACPTDAITPYSVDASRCISYLTIERRGPIDPGFYRGMGEWIFGCDICQEVCPHNSARPKRWLERNGGKVNPEYLSERDSFDLLEVLGWDEDARREAFTSSAMKRARLDMMKRNAVIAAGNAIAEHDLPELRARVAEIAGDAGEAEMVREAASVVLELLERSGR